MTRARQILDLQREEAAQSLPVEISGVITLFNREYQLCYLQDATAGVYIWIPDPPDNLSTGITATIRGTSGAGLFSPIVWNSRIETGASSELPRPAPVTVDAIRNGNFDAQWVELSGVVYSQEFLDPHYRLELGAGGHSINVVVFDESPASGVVPDARVKIQGVVVVRPGSSGGPAVFKVFSPSSEHVQLLRPAAPDPFNQPIELAAELFDISHRAEAPHRVRVHGIVLFRDPAGIITVQDNSGTIQARLADPNSGGAPGDLVDVIGFPSRAGSEISLVHGATRVLGRSQVPLPEKSQKPTPRLRNRLVELDGRIVASRPGDEQARLWLAGSDAVTEVRLLHRATAEQLRPLEDRQVSAAGLLTFEGDHPVLFLNSLAEITPANALRTANSRDNWPLLIGAFLLGSAGSLVLVLRTRQAKLQRGQRSAPQIPPEDASASDDPHSGAAAEARARIARDLHDGIIQSVYAVGLHIEDLGERSRREKPEFAERVHRVRDDLNLIIRDIRNYIAGLQPEILNGRELPVALRSLTLAFDERNASRFTLDVNADAASKLDSAQSTQLVHIAREAMTNAVRHARAGRVEVLLQDATDRVRFEVRDDGVGFNTQTPSARGCGLRNIARRAEELNATLCVVSQRGEGTRIVLDIPYAKPHESLA